VLSKDDSFSCKFPVPFQFFATVKYVSTDIWHYRLGHLSPSRLQLLHSNNPHISCDLMSTPCTICHLAKQKRLSFPHSVTVSTSIFDLIHCDIWGPFSVGSRNGHHYFLTIVDDYSRFQFGVILKSHALDSVMPPQYCASHLYCYSLGSFFFFFCLLLGFLVVFLCVFAAMCFAAFVLFGLLSPSSYVVLSLSGDFCNWIFCWCRSLLQSQIQTLTVRFYHFSLLLVVFVVPK
jgi:hypothetical protein